MKQSERLENINNMESIYNKLDSSLKDMKKSFLKRKKLLPDYKKLMKYYESEQWQKDYDDVNNWKIKPEWPHWILGEDAIYDFYQEQRELATDMIKIANKVLKI